MNSLFGYLTGAVCLSPLTVNRTCCALGISQHINTKNRNKPSETEGHRLLSRCQHFTIKIIASALIQTNLETRESRQFHKDARGERMNDTFLPCYTFAQVGELDCNGQSRYGNSHGKQGLGCSHGPGYVSIWPKTARTDMARGQEGSSTSPRQLGMRVRKYQLK